MEEKREQKWIRRVLRWGDRKAAGELVELYYQDIFRLVARQTGEDRETVLDLTQEVFLSMLTSLSGYDNRKASFRTWLYRIATHKIVDRYRGREYKMQRSSVPLEEELPDAVQPFFQALEEGEITREILEKIRNFPGETQEILRLHIFARQTFETIGESMGLPSSTVKTRYYRAVEKIRKEMEI